MRTTEELNAIGLGKLPGLIGVEIVSVTSDQVVARLSIRPDHLAPNGYLHAGTVVTLADTAAGYGTIAALPEGAVGFTTVELKTNFLGTARQGAITCTAQLRHGGRTTHVWDAEVTDEENGRVIALFRCTQFILYARKPAVE